MPDWVTRNRLLDSGARHGGSLFVFNTTGIRVSTATVVEKAIAATQEFSGRLEAIDVVAIRPRVSGFITAVNFKPGSEVKKGDVLFEIDPRPFQAETERAEAADVAQKLYDAGRATELSVRPELVPLCGGPRMRPPFFLIASFC